MKRGEVYRFKTPKGLGHEQHGVRFAVVVQADEFLPRTVVIVAPTSRSARQASFRPAVEIDGETTLVLVEQLGAVDVQRLGRRVSRLGLEEIWSVDEALATYVAMYETHSPVAPISDQVGQRPRIVASQALTSVRERCGHPRG